MTFTLAHLSDPHLPMPPRTRYRELANKRALGYLNYTRNRHAIHRRDILDMLVGDIQAQQPDHIAVTGDLLNISLTGEFGPAREWLESVGPPDRVSVVPGNHDAYVTSTALRFGEDFAAYLSGDNGVAGFPYLRRRGNVVLIGVSSAVPTAPFMATGRLGSAQRAKLEILLAGLTDQPVFRVLMIHHPLRSRSRFKRLTDSRELIALLQRYPVDLILHGHDHVHATIWIDTPIKSIPVVGVPSASAFNDHHRPSAAYNFFTISQDGTGWHCEHRSRGFAGTETVQELREPVML
jgi:3',5'-cyclic AMP phosphodiesterase CpdA